MASLSTLDPDLRPWAEEFYRLAHQVVPGLVVTSARRTWFEQFRLYVKYLEEKGGNVGRPMLGWSLGQEEPKKVIPAAPPGTSAHEHGMAFDLARLNVDPWKDEFLPRLGAIWIRIGGIWRSSDPVHFEG